MPTERKRKLVKNLEEKFKKAQGVFFTDYQSMGTNTLNELRRKLADVEADYQIVKNTLVNIACEDIKLKGPSAALFTYRDPLNALKILAKFKEKFKWPTFKLGILEDKVISAEEMEVLARLPNREALIAQVIQVIKNPLTSLVGVLSANQRKIVYALKLIADEKAK